jgi:hypothetical protein
VGKPIGKIMAVLVIVMLISSARSYAATIYAKSASYSDVSYAVSQATYGDTVVVPAGKANWSTELIVTKYMTIEGNGIDSTIITNSGINDTRKGIIRFTPDSTSRSADGLFRVTALTLKNIGGLPSPQHNNSSKGILIGRSGGGYVNTTHYFNIRIDHCSFYDFGFYSNTTVGNNPIYYGSAIAFSDIFAFGLIDNCYFYGSGNGTGIMGITGYYMGQTRAALEYAISPGTNRAIYVEDCYFEKFFRNIAGLDGLRYVFRFNETKHPKYNSWANLDAHGGGPASYCPYFPNDPNVTAARGTLHHEAYLNKVDMTGITSGRFFQNRGGTWRIWGNQVTAGGRLSRLVDLEEEDAKDTRYANVPCVVRHNSVYYECKVNHTSSSASEPGVGAQWTTYWKTNPYQTSSYSNWATGADYRYNTGYDPHSGYYWDNTVNGTYQGPNIYSPGGVTYPASFLIHEDREFWQYKASFNGTSGMGVGTKAEMSAVGNPNPGVGFWVTDEGGWNRSAGSNVLSYTGQGRLYRANNSRKWESYYEPYTYPHPLRAGKGENTSTNENVSVPSGVAVKSVSP